MTELELEDGFEDKLQEAVLAQAEQQFRDEYGPALMRIARENWGAYASRNDYDIEHIWEDAELFVERDGDSIQVRIEWPGLTGLFEWGVAPHTISGNPMLHFYYERIGQWIKTDEVNWGSETGGIPESRAIRDALNEFRRLMQRG